MKFIEFNKEKCDACLKCLRVCPTKAIAFNGEKRAIVDDLCIKCGLCQATCPQEALKIRNLMSQVLAWVNGEEKVAISLAPSYVGAFGLEAPRKMATALFEIGFDYVEETAIGAEVVAKAYDKVIETGHARNIVTSCCPSANYLVEQYFPLVIKSMIPVVSPMVAHGRLIKEAYGEDTKVVFIGPCLAKMAEAEEFGGSVDAVLTFDELEDLLKSKGIRVKECSETDFSRDSAKRGRAFPLGGSLNTIDNRRRDDESYNFIHVSGYEACKDILNELKIGNLNHCCVEMNICEGSCINGPDMPKNTLSRYSREIYMRRYGRSKASRTNASIVPENNYKGLELSRSFRDRQLRHNEPNNQMIRQMLQQMGKFSDKEELNCGACGYTTCKDKAKAAYLGYSDIDTCLPHLREKAESMQSIMIENSPNAVLIINNDLTVKEVNPTFVKLFNREGLPMIDMPLELFVQSDTFGQVFEMKESALNRRGYNAEIDCYFIINAVYIEESDVVIAFLTDISEDEKRRLEFRKVKEETLIKTQEVIDKQMRVAQEIASLLGETTAETKMSLKSLNQLVLSDTEGY